MISFKKKHKLPLKRKKSDSSTTKSLEDKIRSLGGRDGFALETNAYQSAAKSSKFQRKRHFRSSNQSMGYSSWTSTESDISRNQSNNQIGTRCKKFMSDNSRLVIGGAATHIVCAISENLAKETCVASLDAGSPTILDAVKQGNRQTYAETLAYLEVLQPDEILLNEGRRNSHLTQKILSLYERTNPINVSRSISQHYNYSEERNTPCETCTVVKFIPRFFFDQTKGANLLRRISRMESYDASIVEEYIILSSSYAILQYTQLCLGANFAQNCLKLSVCVGGRNRMSIDRATLLHLEFLANSKTGKIENSLIGTIDCTKTTVGSRMLRSNLIAPPTDIDTINTRLELVDSFISDEAFFYAVMDHLKNLPDINRMLAGIALAPWKKGEKSTITHRIASKGISALVCIKTVLAALPVILQVLRDQLHSLGAHYGSSHKGSHKGYNKDIENTKLKGSLLVGLGEASTYSGTKKAIQQHHLLRAIIHVMSHPDLDDMLATVTNIFTDSTVFATKAESMRHQECFALKPRTDGMLDVIRHTFLANCDDIYRLADEYAATFDIKVTVKYSTTRGYILAIPVELGAELPRIFIQPVKAGRFINCSTEEVQSLNSRAQDNIQDLLLMTHEHIQEVLDFARKRYDAIASLSDAIALLDLCHSFADNIASSCLPWTRPIVNNGNDFTVRNGRYCINPPFGLATRERQESTPPGQYVPNHTYAPGHRNFIILTGANGSGKSTYLKQLAIICVLAHCGSYVPAEKAIVPIRSMLCTRIGVADDQEHNISTFMLEMKETAFICQNAGKKSLILIDELGRATSNEDGLAIAWAVSEYLRKKQSTTFFVTHYLQLSKLADTYPGIWNLHMGIQLSRDGSSVFYSHRIQNGPCEIGSGYGIEIASSCGWPVDVVGSAMEMGAIIKEQLPDCSTPVVALSQEFKDRRSCPEILRELCKRLKTVSEEFDSIQLRENLECLWHTLIADGSQSLKSTQGGGITKNIFVDTQIKE
eukprot:CAMPEP_0194140966 /NCGR_PEP_ID=MMETSP0152-20130528/10464_1 /TAXON_ID=1049557 /ORGANISM="Thalassiothrix antarctica, Strain L6-D1" /LENGTH=993 /DNA_ID=CAMNT_0038839439 /DNA_START=639 /DNA_END=3621 /DNA_ORIENTATION=-